VSSGSVKAACRTFVILTWNPQSLPGYGRAGELARTGGRYNGWMEGWMDGWLDGWMEGHKHKSTDDG
jgi:hypothetical protein